MRALRSQTLREPCALFVFGGLLLYAYSQLTYFIPSSLTGIMLDTARNLYEGKGLVTNVVTLGFLTAYKHVQPPVPYLWYPLIPVVTSWLFHLFGMKPWVVLTLPVLSYLSAAITLFFLGRRLFGSATAIAAASFLLIQPILIDTTLNSNFSDPVMVFLLLASVLCVFIASESNRFTMVWLAIAGAVLGIAQYARSAGMMLYLPMTFLVISMFPERRLLRFAGFMIACFTVQLPLFAFNLRATGSLMFAPTYLLLFLTPLFPGFSANRMLLPASPLKIVQLYSGQILEKWLSQIWVHYKYFFTMTNPIVLVGALLALSTKLNRSQVVLRNFTFVFYVCLVLQNSLMIWDNRYLLPVVPFLSLLGFDFIRRTLSQLPPRRPIRALAVTALVLLVSIDAIDFFYQAMKHREEQRVHWATTRELARFIRENARPGCVVMATDVGLVAWETRNATIGIPVDLETAVRIYREFVRFDTMILSTVLPHESLYKLSPDWGELVAGRKTFLGFYRDKELTLPSGETLVLLRDRAGMEHVKDGNERVTSSKGRLGGSLQ